MPKGKRKNKKEEPVGVELHLSVPTVTAWDMPSYSDEVDWRLYHSSSVGKALGYQFDENGHYVKCEDQEGFTAQENLGELTGAVVDSTDDLDEGTIIR